MADPAETGRAILEGTLPVKSSLLPQATEDDLVGLLSTTEAEKEAAQRRWEEFIANSGMSPDEANQYLNNASRGLTLP